MPYINHLIWTTKMIKYSFPKEKEISLHYASILHDKTALRILTEGNITNVDDVKALAAFYWDMVDHNVKEAQSNTRKDDDMEKWLERIYTTFHIYFNNIGYGNVWDDAIL